jgi:hypothetical protein
MPTNEVESAKGGFVVTHVSCRAAIGIACVPTALLISVILLAIVAWFGWVLANSILGTPGATLLVAGLLAVATAFSRCTGRPLGYSLIMVAFGSFMLSAAALYGVAGYVLIFGG